MNSIRITSLYGSKPSSVVFGCKRATFRPELQVFMGSRPHLAFLDAKQGILDQNYKSLWIVDLTWRFVHAKQRLWIRITSLYEFKLSSVFLCIENRVPSIRITSPYGSQASPVIFCMQNSVPNIRITSIYWSQPSSEVFACKTTTFVPE